MTADRKLARGNRAEVQALVEEVVRVVCDHVHEERLRMYLFGSWAQGRALSVSDLDIALDTGRPISPAIIQKIAYALDELPTLRRVDIVDLQAVDQGFRKRVLQQGELIHGK
jgi:predicted nucleotidyltransferase